MNSIEFEDVEHEDIVTAASNGDKGARAELARRLARDRADKRERSAAIVKASEIQAAAANKQVWFAAAITFFTLVLTVAAVVQASLQYQASQPAVPQRAPATAVP